MTIGEQYYAAFCAIDAVKAIHDCRLAWRDVKPANFVRWRLSYVGIDLDGVKTLEEMMDSSAKVSCTSMVLCPILSSDSHVAIR